MKLLFVLLIACVFFASCSVADKTLNHETVFYESFNKKSEKLKTENQPSFSKGINGKAINLAQTKGKIEIVGADTSWFSNQNDFSVSLWVKATKATTDTTIILSNADFSKKPMGIYGNRRKSKGITLYACNGSWGWNIANGSLVYNYEPLQSDQPVADGKWHQLAFTYNAKKHEARLYYDGVNKAVLSLGDLKNKDFKSGLALRIGKNKQVSPGYSSFNGLVDELKIRDKIISTEEICNEYEMYGNTEVKEPEMKGDEFTVVNWNIWHGGTHFTKEKDGFDGIERTIELIEKAGADIVLMQETYGAGSQISSSLGFYYYEASSTIGAVWGANLSVMSRFPIEDAFMLEVRSNYGKNYAFNNGGVKIKLSENKSVIAFSNWYNGRKPEDLEGALTGWKDLIENADKLPIVYAGDFNSVSHLDDGLGESGHSKLMTDTGFIDTYRRIFPNANSHPGYTAGRFEDRIDYIYYKGQKLKLQEASSVEPNFRGKEDKTPGYPSDHLGLVAKFKYIN